MFDNLGYKIVVNVTVGAGLKVRSPVLIKRSAEILLTFLKILDDLSRKFFESWFSMAAPEAGSNDGGLHQLVIIGGNQSLKGMSGRSLFRLSQGSQKVRMTCLTMLKERAV